MSLIERVREKIKARQFFGEVKFLDNTKTPIAQDLLSKAKIFQDTLASMPASERPFMPSLADTGILGKDKREERKAKRQAKIEELKSRLKNPKWKKSPPSDSGTPVANKAALF